MNNIDKALDDMTLVNQDQYLEAVKYSIENKMNLLVSGAPGVGKTQIPTDYCTQNKINMIKSTPSLAERIDYRGLPAIIDGRAVFLPFEELERAVSAKERTLFILDDFGQAENDVQAGSMHLLGEKRVGDLKISDEVTFLTLTNRRQDKAHVRTGILEPVKSRHYSLLELYVEVDPWVRYALNRGLPTPLIAYIRFRGLEALHAFVPSNDMVNTPCPRTVEFAGWHYLKAPDAIKWNLIAGACGNEWSTDFRAFEMLYGKIPNPDLIIMNPSTAEVPDITRENGLSILFCVVSALAERADRANFDSIVTYTKRLPDTHQEALMKDALTRDPDLANTRGYIDWASTRPHFTIK